MEKHKITQDLVSSFKNMLMSQDNGDATLALSILDNRDKNDPETEANFKQIGEEIIDNKTLFPINEIWVVRMNGKVLWCNGEGAFTDKSRAMSFASRHLTSYLGTSRDRDVNRHALPGYWDKKDLSKHPYGEWIIDPNILNYVLSLKHIFKGGKELRDFLIKNKIIEIVNINAT